MRERGRALQKSGAFLSPEKNHFGPHHDSSLNFWHHLTDENEKRILDRVW